MSDLTWSNESIKVISGSGPAEYHLFAWPDEDLIEHDPYEWSCACSPTYKITIGPHVGAGLCLCTVYELIHHSLDGRELFK